MLRQQDFVRNWDCDDGVPAFHRLVALLAVCNDRDELAADTAGQRNRRYLALHRDLIGRNMEAQARCSRCETLCEFPLPRDAMLASPSADPKSTVSLSVGGKTYRFRVPNMTDIAALPKNLMPSEIGSALAQACLVEAGGTLPDTVVRSLSAALDEADPLASPVFAVECEQCAESFSATVDLAGFVARELDLLLDRILRDVDRLARAYGWSELEILAIPSARRTRYLAMLGASARSARPVAV